MYFQKNISLKLTHPYSITYIIPKMFNIIYILWHKVVIVINSQTIQIRGF